jgi:hypothetical protein
MGATAHDLSAIDELMTEDYRITTGGQVIAGCGAFKRWVADMQIVVESATNEHLEVFTSQQGDRVVSRWVCRGTNKGMFRSAARRQTDLIFRHRDLECQRRKMAECWVERSAWKLYNILIAR